MAGHATPVSRLSVGGGVHEHAVLVNNIKHDNDLCGVGVVGCWGGRGNHNPGRGTPSQNLQKNKLCNPSP